MTRINNLFDAQRVIDAELAQDKKLTRGARALSHEMEEMAIERRRELDWTESVRETFNAVEGAATGVAKAEDNDEAKAICGALKESIGGYLDRRVEVEGQQVEGFERAAEGQRRLAEEAKRHSDAVRDDADGPGPSNLDANAS